MSVIADARRTPHPHAAPRAATPLDAQQISSELAHYLYTVVGLDSGQVRDVAAGNLVVKVLDTRLKGDVAVFGMIPVDVTREFYVNDYGTQMRRFGQSLAARYGQALGIAVDLPAEGYQADYVADIARELAKAGLNVVIFNQRSVDEILSMILTLSAMVGAADKGKRLIEELENNLESIRLAAQRFPRRPRVYFEEWDEPMISAIRWVSELIGIAGGEDIFSELSRSHAASGRTIKDGSMVIDQQPDVILGSWCGKKFAPAKVAARAGFAQIPAVANGWLREIKSTLILQPGPAALTDGLDALTAIIAEWVESRSAAAAA